MNISLNRERALSVVDKAFDFLGNTYVGFIILAISLFYNNYYFDMLQAKWYVFVYGTLIYICFFSILFRLKIFMCKYVPKVSLIDVVMIVFLISISVGMMVSHDVWEVFMGTAGWGMGVFYFVLCVFITLSLTQIKFSIENLELVFVISYFMVNFLAILNLFDVDPLGFQINLLESDKGNYISTIGNVNWYGAYMALCFPMVIMTLMVSEKLYRKIIYSILYIISFFNIIICNSDCALICLMGGGIFFIFSVIKGKINYKNYSLICLYNGMILIVINVLKEINWFEDMGKLQCFIGSYFVGGVFIVFSMICLLRNKQLIKISVIFLVIIAVLGGKYCKEYFIFDSSWGNNRGYIWGYAVEILKKGDLFEVLFGRGCDTFGGYANQYFKDEISLIWNKRLINAHNEFLQLLVTCGCVGVSSYYFAWFGYIRRGLKQNKMPQVIISISLLTYLIQQLVNNIQTITTPLSFVFLGGLNSLVMKEISKD